MSDFRDSIEEIKKIEDAFNPPVVSYDPTVNKDAISIIRQPDGNWKGWMQKDGVVVEVRDISPGTVLERLITRS